MPNSGNLLSPGLPYIWAFWPELYAVGFLTISSRAGMIDLS
jgi:hypothetical protein